MAFELFNLKAVIGAHNQLHEKNHEKAYSEDHPENHQENHRKNHGENYQKNPQKNHQKKHERNHQKKHEKKHEENRKRVDVNTTFGLEVFSLEFNNLLAQGFELYHRAYYLHKGFEGKRIHEYRAQLNRSRSLSALKKLSSDRLNDGRAANSFLLREQKGKSYSGLNQGFAHYPHHALLEAYETLRVLESQLIYAGQQIRLARSWYRLFQGGSFFNPVPEDIAKVYSEHIERQLKIIKDEYGKLTRAMMERLMLAAQDHTLQHGDALYQYEPEGLIEDKLSQTHFQDFYNVIKISGDPEIKQQLAQKSWFEMAEKISENPSLRPFHEGYTLAQIGIVVQRLSEQANENENGSKDKKYGKDKRNEKDQKDQKHEKYEKYEKNKNEQEIEKFQLSLSMADSTLGLIQKEIVQSDKAKDYFSAWWRRIFEKNKKTLNTIALIKKRLCAEEESLLKSKAIIQRKIMLITARLERDAKEALLLTPFRQKDFDPTEEDLNKLISYCKTMNRASLEDKEFLEEADKLASGIFDYCKQKNPELLMVFIRLLEVLSFHLNKLNDDKTIVEVKSKKPFLESSVELSFELGSFESDVFQTEVESLQDLLLISLVSRFGFSKESLEYLMNLKSRMIERNITDVKNLPALTSSDKAFLGLYEQGWASYFFYEDRKIVSITLNIVVSLELQKKEMAKLEDKTIKEEQIQRAKAMIYRYFDKYGTREIHQIIKTRNNLCTTKPK